MKICSFLPSATEILFAIGAGPQVAAVTFECDYPPEARALPQVVFSHLPHGLAPAEIDAIVSAEGAKGKSLYFVDLPKLEALAPDMIVLQDLCRVCALDSPTLARDMRHLPSGPQVISLSGHTLAQIFSEIEFLGAAVGCGANAQRLITELKFRIRLIQQTPKPALRPRVLCLEWLDPLFQGGHWIPEMVTLAGGDPVLAAPGEKSRRITWPEVIAADPEIVVVMPCGYHLAETIEQFRAITLPPEWNELSAIRNNRLYAVDGTAYFSRPGPRLITGLEILHAILKDGDEDKQAFTHLPKQSVTHL